MPSKILRLIIPLGLLAVFSAFSASRVSFNLDALELLPPGVPEVDAFAKLVTHFSRTNELIVTLETDDDPYLAEEAMRSLVTFLESNLKGQTASIRGELPIMEEPELGAQLISWMWLNSDPENFSTLASRLSSNQSRKQLTSAMEEIQSGFFSERSMLLGYDPLSLTTFGNEGEGEFLSAESNGFESADGNFRTIFVEARVDSFPTYQDADIWVKSVRTAVSNWKESNINEELDLSAVTIDFTGEPVFVAEIARSMEKDLTQSVVFTTIIICVLFWLMHLRLAPLLWLVLMLAVVFSGTFAAGGLILGKLSAMSIGFAAILIGLAVDYGVVLYRERAVAKGNTRALRRQIGPGILWAAATTAAVFISMNFSTLPAVRELGTLVALGIGIGAIVMLGMFAPIVASVPPETLKPKNNAVFNSQGRTWAFTAIILAACIGTVALVGWPEVNRESRPFHLRSSPAMTAMKRIGAEIQGGSRSMSVLVSAESNEALSKKLIQASTELQKEIENGTLKSFRFPTALTVNPSHQKENIETLRNVILPEETRLISEITATGFTADATKLTRKVFREWAGLSQQLDRDESYALPEGDVAQWLISRMISRRDQSVVVLGELSPTDEETYRKSPSKSESDSFVVAGWRLLNPALHRVIEKDFTGAFLPMGVILIGMLAVVFRDWRDVLLSLASLAFAAISLIALTLWLPIEWNFFNLTGIPILFGTGLDYSIHMIFALRRSNGDRSTIHYGIGRALLFCGCSTAVGFGSLSFAGTQGLSTLGVICGIGILLNMVTAVWLLPNWWRTLHRVKLKSVSPVGL